MWSPSTSEALLKQFLPNPKEEPIWLAEEDIKTKCLETIISRNSGNMNGFNLASLNIICDRVTSCLQSKTEIFPPLKNPGCWHGINSLCPRCQTKIVRSYLMQTHIFDAIINVEISKIRNL